MFAYLLGCKTFKNKEKTKDFYKVDFAFYNDTDIYLRLHEQFVDEDTYKRFNMCEKFTKFDVSASINDFGNPILKVMY